MVVSGNIFAVVVREEKVQLNTSSSSMSPHSIYAISGSDSLLVYHSDTELIQDSIDGTVSASEILTSFRQHAVGTPYMRQEKIRMTRIILCGRARRPRLSSLHLFFIYYRVVVLELVL